MIKEPEELESHNFINYCYLYNKNH